MSCIPPTRTAWPCPPLFTGPLFLLQPAGPSSTSTKLIPAQRLGICCPSQTFPGEGDSLQEAVADGSRASRTGTGGREDGCGWGQQGHTEPDRLSWSPGGRTGPQVHLFHLRAYTFNDGVTCRGCWSLLHRAKHTPSPGAEKAQGGEGGGLVGARGAAAPRPGTTSVPCSPLGPRRAAPSSECQRDVTATPFHLHSYRVQTLSWGPA